MEMVMRLNSRSEDVEILSQEDNGSIYEKMVNIKDLAKEMVKMTSIDFQALQINNFDGNVLYYSRNKEKEYYIIRLPERKIKCTYKGKGYSLIHPDSVFVLQINANNKQYDYMKAYAIKEYTGGKTELYKYPFPNMLSSNSICTGTISKDATDPMKAILNVIEGNYTHDHPETPKYKTTAEFFKAMKKSFDYDLLENSGQSVESLVGTLKM